MSISEPSKGQLISKANFEVSFEPTIEQKYFDIFALALGQIKKECKSLYYMINNNFGSMLDIFAQLMNVGEKDALLKKLHPIMKQSAVAIIN